MGELELKANVENKVILILGGAGGIGAAAARDLAAHGARIAVADINKVGADLVAKEIAAAGGETRSYLVDVVQQDQVQTLVADVEADFGRIDVLINAAGVMFIRPLIEIQTVEWEITIDLNVKGTFWGVAAVLPVFLKQRSGHIVNLSSVHGLRVFTLGGAVHSASKFAIRAFTEGLRAELASFGIRVTSITPGATDTGIQNKTTGADSARMLEIYKNAIPASAVSGAILYAISQPGDVDVNEVVIRPTAQEI
jgi:NADP-dependent 3-hydroxy acid dehydrogenase YdfG